MYVRSHRTLARPSRYPIETYAGHFVMKGILTLIYHFYINFGQYILVKIVQKNARKPYDYWLLDNTYNNIAFKKGNFLDKRKKYCNLEIICYNVTKIQKDVLIWRAKCCKILI